PLGIRNHDGCCFEDRCDVREVEEDDLLRTVRITQVTAGRGERSASGVQLSCRELLERHDHAHTIGSTARCVQDIVVPKSIAVSYRWMQLHQLTYFVEVARTRHFTRAAESVHVAQPSLS